MIEISNKAIIGKNVSIGEGTKIYDGVVIEGYVKIGKNCKIFPYAVIGTPPQDLKYKDEKSYIEIGDNNVIREFVTIHSATGEENKTIIGNNNYIMAYCHIAHNCIVGNNVTLINGATLGGHVIVEDKAIISAFTAVHQYSRIGSLAMVGACSKVVKDVPPYVLADGHPLQIYGLNTRGFERNNVPIDIRNALKKLFKIFYRENLTVEEAIKKIEKEIYPYKEVLHFIEFVKSSKLGVYR
jgi:UDP-N-acetylglucosamine acyltransferase